jgi:hypothetical protein
MFRSSNYFHDPKTGGTVLTTGGVVRSNIWLAKLTPDLDIDESTLQKIDFSDAGIKFKRGAEDGRLFWRDGGWQFTAGLYEPEMGLPRIGLFSLDKNYKAKLETIYTSGELKDVEKNWMTSYKKNPNFDYVYGPGQVYVDGVGPVSVKEVTKNIKGIRGGSQLWDLGDTTYLAIVHRAYSESVLKYIPRFFSNKIVKVRTYSHMFVRYSNTGKILQTSNEFVFQHWGIEFASGLVVKDSEVVISYGYKDVSSYLAKMPLKDVLNMLKDVQ